MRFVLSGMLWLRLNVNMVWISGMLKLVKCQAFAKCQGVIRRFLGEITSVGI